MSKPITNAGTQKTSFFNKKIPIGWFITTSLIAIISLSFEIGSAFSHGDKNLPAASPARQNSPQENSKETQIPQNQSGYGFTNPVIACDGPIKEVRPFKNEIQAEIDKILKENIATDIAVNYRMLNNGYAFGINAEKLFRPASLLKVPTMVAYLKMAEDSPAILDRKVVFSKTMDISIPNSIPNPMVPGQSYTIRELINRMIINSDNDAALILTDEISEKAMEKTYDVFGLKVPKVLRPDYDFSSVADFGRIFRILYNASYLNKEMSDYALNVLSKAYFTDGIVAGVGDGTPVAHKYGEWYNNGVYQLHDCGIVYVQGNSYILCIMTKGHDVHKLAGVIQRISNLIYHRMQIELDS